LKKQTLHSADMDGKRYYFDRIRESSEDSNILSNNDEFRLAYVVNLLTENEINKTIFKLNKKSNSQLSQF
jgi:hypothetical protein